MITIDLNYFVGSFEYLKYLCLHILHKMVNVLYFHYKKLSPNMAFQLQNLPLPQENPKFFEKVHVQQLLHTFMFSPISRWKRIVDPKEPYGEVIYTYYIDKEGPHNPTKFTIHGTTLDKLVLEVNRIQGSDFFIQVEFSIVLVPTNTLQNIPSFMQSYFYLPFLIDSACRKQPLHLTKHCVFVDSQRRKRRCRSLRL